MSESVQCQLKQQLFTVPEGHAGGHYDHAVHISEWKNGHPSAFRIITGNQRKKRVERSVRDTKGFGVREDRNKGSLRGTSWVFFWAS